MAQNQKETAASRPLKAPEEDGKDKQEVTVSLAAAKEISAETAPLREADGIFTLEEEQGRALQRVTVQLATRRCHMSNVAPTGSFKLSVHPLISKLYLLFPNVFYGLFPKWTCAINPKNVVKVRVAVSDYVQLSI